jgi:hypothetical protein
MSGRESKANPALLQRVLSSVFVNIGRCLDTKELCNSQRVSKIWRKSCSEKPEVFRYLDFSFCSPHSINDLVVSQVIRLHPNAISLNLKFCSKLTAQALPSATTLKELTEINLEGCGRMLDDKALLLLRPCSKLRRVVLDGCSRLTAPGLKSFVQTFKELELLSLNGVTAVNDQLLAAFADANISYLRINSAASITDIGLTSLASKLGPKLLELHLAYCAAVTDKGIEAIATLCPNLTDLNIYGIQNLTDRSLVALRQCSNLQTLDLSMCRSIRDTGMMALLKGGSKIRSLNLYDCSGLTSQTINAVADLCPNLRYLGAFGLEDITTNTARAFLKRAKKLQRVDFGGCSKLPASDIEMLAKEFVRVMF